MESSYDQKLNALGEFIKASNDRSAEELLSQSELAKQLFLRAPQQFFEKNTLERLATITERGQAALDHFFERNDLFHIHTYENDKVTELYLTMGDRPFVITSLRTCLRDFELMPQVLLHPIVRANSRQVSLSYIELPKISVERLALLERRLRRTLEQLVLCTDDYNQMVVQAETIARNLVSSTYASTFSSQEREEVSEFLKWLTDGAFTFLGHACWKVSNQERLDGDFNDGLGVFRAKDEYIDALVNETSEDAVKFLESTQLVANTRLKIESIVHRRSRIHNVLLLEVNTEGRTLAVHSFLGLFTSRALSQESSQVPLIRRKLHNLLQMEGAVESSFDYKNIVEVIDSMPKDEALSLSTDELQEIVRSLLAMQHDDDTRVSLRFDSSRRGVSVMLAMPRERFSTSVRNRLQQYVESVFGAAPGTSEYHLSLTNKPLAKVFFYVPFQPSEASNINMLKVKAELAHLTRSWEDNLKTRILADQELSEADETWRRYRHAFPEGYQAFHSPDEGKIDLNFVDRLTPDNRIDVRMADTNAGIPGGFTLIVYNLGSEITISTALPILEKAGLDVINEKSFCIQPQGSDPIYVHRFLVQAKDSTHIQRETFERFLGPGLTRIFAGEAENDALNSLMISSNLDLRSISVLRLYCRLLWQVSSFATRSSIVKTLASEPSVASLLWNMFEVRFDPRLEYSLESRAQRFATLRIRFEDSLRDVKAINQDRILRSLLDILTHTVRTNFYSTDDAIAIKVRSAECEVMPQPRPLFEIFVCSPRIEGVHLRASEVARGGLRWSDRKDDFRSEILGLMKTQKMKNSVIVPGGAKGGFVLKKLPEDPSSIRHAVEEAYKEFIRSLLSVTDNRVEERVVHPAEMVIYDDPDPYFVVAADKGTATFSDVANKIAVEEYDFWLGDAFASGGSEGYDHKLYGITAKGAWESVKRHFNDLGIDHENAPFRVVGIGDMSGDVFGNGMLLSDQIKLLGAFNHKHIFIDPDPDPASSFKERKRLFATPGSQWSDYSSDLISKGGGIYGRFDKEITLSAEARAALSVSESLPEVVNGEELIHHILQAKVELLWNGGIGTYVKSSSESNPDVNDGTNDRVRVDADQLRALVVGEGGNLGMTQRSRIEFAQKGGRVNTDAIDNSGGVDLSDHEVNLKILFQELLVKEKLSMEQRNDLLRQMAAEVVEDVLEHNKNHALLLTLGIDRSRKSVEYFRTLIRHLVKQDYMDRKLENLPEDDELIERAQHKRGLSRPELAICLNAVKLWIKDVILECALSNDPLLKRFLLDYFPERLREEFKQEILEHPLARHIITSQVTNDLIDTVGITFIHRMCLRHSAPPEMVVKCALAAEILLGTRAIREGMKRFDNCTENSYFLSICDEINGALREATSWLIRYHGTELTLAEIIELYEKPYQTLLGSMQEVLVGEEREHFSLRSKKYVNLGVEDEAAASLATFPIITPILEVLWAAHESSADVKEVARVYTAVMEELDVYAIITKGKKLEPVNKWEFELQSGAIDDIRRAISTISLELLNQECGDQEFISRKLQDSSNFDQLNGTIEEAQEHQLTVSALSVIAKMMRNFSVFSSV